MYLLSSVNGILRALHLLKDIFMVGNVWEDEKYPNHGLPGHGIPRAFHQNSLVCKKCLSTNPRTGLEGLFCLFATIHIYSSRESGVLQTQIYFKVD